MVCIDDEIPFEIPESWTWGRLSNMVLINPKNYVDDNKEAAFIPMEKIEATYLSSYTYTVRKWREIKSGYTHFADGDVAFAKITPCFQNRKSMILNNLPNGIGAGTTELKVLRPYRNTLSVEYLLFFLESPYFVEEAVFKGTANQQRIISGYLENKLFPLPPLNEQRRIAEKIKKSIVAVEQYGKVQDKLEDLNNNLNTLLKKSVLQEAIQGKLVPQDPNDEPASVLLQRIKEEKKRLVKEGRMKKKDIVDSIIYKGDDNKYYEQIGEKSICIDNEVPFEIPESWQWCRIGTICIITNGFTPLRTEEKFWLNGDINWFTIDDIRTQGEYINFTKQKITKEAITPKRVVREGSILLCCTASVGQCAFTKIPITTNQQFNALTIKDDFCPLILDEYLFVFAKTLKDELHRLSGKTTFEFVSVKKISNLLIPIPPLNEQARIITCVKQALSSIMSR